MTPQANEAVCKADTEDAPPLSPHMNLFGTQKIGALGHIHSWKAVSENNGAYTVFQ